MEGSSAIILVYNPGDLSQENEIELWYDALSKKHGKLSDDRCLLLMYSKEHTGKTKPYPPQSVRGCRMHRIFAEKGPEVKRYFTEFMHHLSETKITE